MCTKLEHGSEQLASNAAWLHKLEQPHCPGMHPYPCGDHWHIGHVDRGGRALCMERHAGWSRGRPPPAATLQQ